SEDSCRSRLCLRSLLVLLEIKMAEYSNISARFPLSTSYNNDLSFLFDRNRLDLAYLINDLEIHDCNLLEVRTLSLLHTMPGRRTARMRVPYGGVISARCGPQLQL